MSKVFRVAALALLVAATRPASAQTGESGDAERLFREGALALKQGDENAACDKLQRSNALEPAIGTLGLLALCHERQGKFATAVDEYRAVTSLARTANQPERANIAAGRVRELSPRVSHLELALPSAGPNLTVTLNDRRLSVAELSTPLALDPGSVTIRASAEHFEPWSSTLVIGNDGRTTKLVIPEPQQLDAPPVLAAAGKPPEPSSAQPLRPQPRPIPVQKADKNEGNPLPWVVLGTGAAGFAVGGFFGVRALASKSDSNAHCVANDCDSEGVRLRDTALNEATASTVAFAVGALATGVGLYLYLSEPDEKRVAAQLTPTTGGGSVSLRGCF